MSNNKTSSSTLPVIIAGAGPCGLIAAITLQSEGIPFQIYERASRERLCSNVGSGFDLSLTTIDILKARLQIQGLDGEGFGSYGGMYMCDMDGKSIRECSIQDLVASSGTKLDFLSANRSAMQEKFLHHLNQNNNKNGSNGEEKTFLKCGIEVVGYEDNNNDDSISVQLSNGSSVIGSALLACDGIHSAVRRCMMSSLSSSNNKNVQTQQQPKINDDLHSCNTICWWGKMDTINKDSEFAKALDTTQTRKSEGVSFIWALSDPSRPGCFMGAPSEGSFMWAFFAKSDNVPSKFSDDLTRRGGVRLDDNSKQDLDNLVSSCGDVIRLAISETPASGITKAGLFDRANLDLPYSNNGRVALLGDAAHPQSPFMAQGVNQAIADAYVCCMRIARAQENNGDGDDNIVAAIREYDSKERRMGVNGVITKARSYGDMSVSKNWFVSWLFYVVAAWMPLSWLWTDMVDADVPNHNFVKQLDNDLGL